MASVMKRTVFTDEELMRFDAEQGSRLLLNAVLKLRQKQHHQALGLAIAQTAGVGR